MGNDAPPESGWVIVFDLSVNNSYSRSLYGKFKIKKACFVNFEIIVKGFFNKSNNFLPIFIFTTFK